MRILIFGLPKTGTTLLHNRVASAFPDHQTELEYVGNPTKPDCVTKLLVDPVVEQSVLASYQKRMMLVRDPRDRFISWLMYTPFNYMYAEADYSRALAYVDMIREKERDPGSVSVWDLTKHVIDWFNPRLEDQFVDLYQSLRLREPSLHFLQVGYELLVAHYAVQETQMQVYLDRPVPQLGDKPAYPGVLERVARTKSHGFWRHWFLPSDVDRFAPQFRRYIDTFGYDPQWTVDPKPTLDPARGSEYVVKLIHRRRSAFPALAGRPFPL